MTTHNGSESPNQAPLAPEPRPDRPWLTRTRSAGHNVWELIKAIWLPVWSRLKVLWLCAYPVALLAAGAWFFVWNDQGADFLRTLAERFWASWGISLRGLLFFLGVAAWSAASWYCSRLLLKRPFPSFPVEFERTAVLRKWLPRVLGACAPAIVAVAFLWNADTAGPSAPRTAFYLLAGIYALLAAAAFAFFVRRRDMFRKYVGDDQPAASEPELSATSQIALWVASILSWALLLAFLADAVWLPRMIGAPALLLLAGASIMLTGSILLTYLPLSRGLPAFTLPVLFAAALFSLWNDNHGVRTTPQPLHAKAAERLPPQGHFNNWLKAKLEASRPEKPHAVFIVAAAGGGIRAAYWTAAVLGRAADESPDLWDRHLYAISGVSGGSLGAAVHAAQLAERGGAQAGSPRYAEHAHDMLREDFLSPVFAYLLFPDLAQRFLPFPVATADRSRAMEASWERSAAEQLHTGLFAGRFVDLWTPEARFRAPALLLNATLVESGQRAIVSNLAVRPDAFPDTIDLLDAGAGQGFGPGLADIPLSAAVHLSARFTYVSPAATVSRAGAGGRSVRARLVDGGYFENSGAATAVDLLRAIWPEMEARSGELGRPVFPVLILVRNDPAAPPACLGEAGGSAESQLFLSEVLAPMLALLNTRTARGRLAEQDAIAYMNEHGAGGPRCEKGCVLEFALSEAQPGAGTLPGTAPPDPKKPTAKRSATVDPPLGWSLSVASQEAMDQQLAENAEQFRCLRELAATGTCERPPPCRTRPADVPLQTSRPSR
jgi:hypothetical protein